VTLATAERRLGVTVGSLVSLSLEPALVGVSIGVDSSPHLLLRDARRFVVNVLAFDQDPVARHFAASVPPIAMWTGIRTRESALPEPLLADALAWIECRTVAEHATGDHAFFVGEVLSVELGRRAAGLVYVEGAYRGVA